MVDTHTCPACQGDGWTFRGLSFERMECPVCKGFGEVESTPVRLSRPARIALAILAAFLLLLPFLAL